MDRIKEKAAKFKLDWEPIRDVIDRVDKIADIAINAGVAYVGYKALRHWSGALTALVAYRLARSNNLAAGVAGIGTLAALGIGAAYVNPALDRPDVYVPPSGYYRPPGLKE